MLMGFRIFYHLSELAVWFIYECDYLMLFYDSEFNFERF